MTIKEYIPKIDGKYVKVSGFRQVLCVPPGFLPGSLGSFGFSVPPCSLGSSRFSGFLQVLWVPPGSLGSSRFSGFLQVLWVPPSSLGSSRLPTFLVGGTQRGWVWINIEVDSRLHQHYLQLNTSRDHK
jgi:hypothetical protein